MVEELEARDQQEEEKEKERRSLTGAGPETSFAEEEIRDLTNKWKRAAADYLNLERRVEKERKAFLEVANVALLRKILPVLNDLERASDHLNDEGLSLIYKKLRAVLFTEGLEEVDTSGDFSPEYHECLELIAGGPKNKIAQTLAKGYIINGKVILPAKVKVFGDQGNEEHP